MAPLFAAWVVSCVGDEPKATSLQPEPGAAEGHYKGACTVDKKCLEGLICVQETVCLYPGDGAPPPDGSGPSNDATSVGCPFSSSSLEPSIPCGATSCANTCCFGQEGPAACDDTCATIEPQRSMKCDSKYQCATGECCLAVKATIETSQCPSPLAFVDIVESVCVPGGCDTSGGSNQYRMCRSNSECAAPARCRQLEITTGSNGTKLNYGICN